MGQVDIPLLVSSVNQVDEVSEYFTDMDDLTKMYERQVGFIVVDETGVQEASTVVDMTGEEPEIIRQSGRELQT